MAMQRTARDIMTTNVATTSIFTTVGEIKRLLANNKISGMPVLRQEKVVGIVSQTDILSSPDDAVAESVMTRDVVSVGPDTPIISIAKALAGRDIDRVPVIDTAGNLVGIVSRADLVASIAAESYWRGDS